MKEAKSTFLNNKSSEKQWKKAKAVCHLNDEEIFMAKRLGKTPLDVIRMIPDKRESWKDPVPLRIRRLYSRKFGTAESREKTICGRG